MGSLCDKRLGDLVVADVGFRTWVRGGGVSTFDDGCDMLACHIVHRVVVVTLSLILVTSSTGQLLFLNVLKVMWDCF